MMRSQAVKTCGRNECALLGERVQPGKTRCCVIPIMGHSGKGAAVETVERSVVARGRWAEHRGCGGSQNSLHGTVMMAACHYSIV